MQILITGAAGQVGSELMAKAGSEAVGVDRKELDIGNAIAVKQYLQIHKPRIVINAAAYTAVDKAEQEAGQAYAANREGPRHLASACNSLDIPLMHLSTDYIFDGRKSTPYLESDAASPLGVYADSKWQGEEQIRSHLMQHLILRVSWVFGEHGNNFVKTILRLAKDRPELRIVADQHGCPTEAGAIADALLLLARRHLDGASPPWGTYHYTGAPATTWHGFACEIVERASALGMIGQKPIIHPITTKEYPLPAPRPANSLLDCTLAEQALGLTRVDWRDSLGKVLKNLNNST